MKATPNDRKANRRGAARLAAVQALYQMDIAATPLNDILAEFESHWIGREVEGEQYLPMSDYFLPMWRLERMMRDESGGGASSMMEQFEQRTGKKLSEV